MSAASSSAKAKTFAVARRRRSFGLDAPRPPSLDRAEAEILAWLKARMPQLLWLRATEPACQGATPTASTLALLLPGARLAVLRIDVAAGRIKADTLALETACRARRIPLCVVRDVADMQAALRRLGIEVEKG